MIKNSIKNRWYVWVSLLLFLAQTAMMTLWGDRSFVAIHDNLDLFVAHNAMLKEAGIFFKQDALAPMLGGVSRDLLGSEFNLYNLLFFFFSPYTAYVISYLLKLLIGFGGSLILAKEVFGVNYEKYRSSVWLVGAAYASIPVFPAYGIAFASLPVCLFLLIKIVKTPGPLWYGLLFCYPVISYFSYFGFFIIGYLVLSIPILWIIKKKLPWSLLASAPVLAAGYIAFEYRLFSEMLFGNTETIRSSMVTQDMSLSEVADTILEVLVDPGFHAQDSHGYWILPICLIACVTVNTGLIRKGEKRRLWSQPINRVLLIIFFNAVVYGFYYYKPFRDLFEALFPMLTGFQFNRTIYFNAPLWYILFLLVIKEIIDYTELKGIKKAGDIIKNILLAGSLAAVLFSPAVYNDFYNNCYHHAYELLKGKESSQLSFGEFYSRDLFDHMKEELDYKGEWSVAYGMHPGVLQYNGISTLDGYLGMYSQEYKDSFRRMIEPALETSEEFRNTFDNWGARAYLYSGAGENTYEPVRVQQLKDRKLYLDTDAFRALGGVYIFSRVELENSRELGLKLKGEFRHENSPYVIYVYGTADLHAMQAMHALSLQHN